MLTESENPFVQIDKLVQAVQFGDYAFVETAINVHHVSPDTKDAQNCSLLHWAAINNRMQIAELLISHHANVNIVGGDGEEIPLQWAVRYSKCLPIIDLLIREKSSLTHLSNTHHDALFLAVIAGQLHVAFVLLNAGANPDTTDKYHDTPILWLLKHRNVNVDTDAMEMMRLLLAFHADVSHAGRHGNNALHVLSPMLKDLNLDLALMLYESGGDRALQSKNEMGKTPWQAAWALKNMKLLRFYWDAHFYTKYPRYLPMYIAIANLTVLFQSLQYFGWIWGLAFAGLWMLVGEMFGQAAIFMGQSRISCGAAWGIIINTVGAYYYYLSQYSSTEFHYFIHCLVFTICFSLWRTMHSKPQHLSNKGTEGRNEVTQKILNSETVVNTSGQEIGKDFRLCTTCLVDKSQASVHCKKCNMCMVDLDHHCPFVNNCVGRGNRRVFVMFTASAALGCALMAWVSWSIQQEEFCAVAVNPKHMWLSRFVSVQWCMLFHHPELRALTLITYMAAASACWIGGICLSQIQMVLSETTTFESLRRHNLGKPCLTGRAVKHLLTFLMTGHYNICENTYNHRTPDHTILAANTAASFAASELNPLLGGGGGAAKDCEEGGCALDHGHDHSHGHGHNHAHGKSAAAAAAAPELTKPSSSQNLGFFGMMSQQQQSPHHSAYSPMSNSSHHNNNSSNSHSHSHSSHGHGQGKCCGHDHDHSHGHGHY